ncbi:MAG TPA: hypothetical protein VGT02_14195 [Methylomirabilota bacterium]|nr:hypothetical protein [Methylomirabilota bacterium]
MPWRWALTKVPWRTLLAHAPTLVDAARRFRRRGPEAERVESPPGDLDALRRAVDTLQSRAMQQAALVEDLAKEVREVTIAVEVLRARIRLAFIAAAVAAAIALLALLLGR